MSQSRCSRHFSPLLWLLSRRREGRPAWQAGCRLPQAFLAAVEVGKRVQGQFEYLNSCLLRLCSVTRSRSRVLKPNRRHSMEKSFINNQSIRPQTSTRHCQHRQSTHKGSRVTFPKPQESRQAPILHPKFDATSREHAKLPFWP